LLTRESLVSSRLGRNPLVAPAEGQEGVSIGVVSNLIRGELSVRRASDQAEAVKSLTVAPTACASLLDSLAASLVLSIDALSEPETPPQPVRKILVPVVVETTIEPRHPFRLEVTVGTANCVGTLPTALSCLNEAQRVVFEMHEMDEFSIPHIAAALDIPVNTAYSRLRLARSAC
jgi:DNA-directed RNA polymerase specialized sigma24 family protein